MNKKIKLLVLTKQALILRVYEWAILVQTLFIQIPYQD